MKLEIEIQNNLVHDVPIDGIDSLAHFIWREEATCEGAISVILVSDEDLVKLNKKFLNRDYKTDVIAFELSDETDDWFEGEIYISIETVKVNADTFNVTPYEELKRVVTHGILHFLGYKDNSDENKEKMREREDYYLDKFKQD